MRSVKSMPFPHILGHTLPGGHPDPPKRPWPLWVGVWLLVACGAAPEPKLEKADSYTLAPRLSVVTLSPSATRFVLALGGKTLLVGVDSASKDLPGTEHLPSVSLESVRPPGPGSDRRSETRLGSRAIGFGDWPGRRRIRGICAAQPRGCIRTLSNLG